MFFRWDFLWALKALINASLERWRIQTSGWFNSGLNSSTSIMRPTLRNNKPQGAIIIINPQIRRCRSFFLLSLRLLKKLQKTVLRKNESDIVKKEKIHNPILNKSLSALSTHAAIVRLVGTLKQSQGYFTSSLSTLVWEESWHLLQELLHSEQCLR